MFDVSSISVRGKLMAERDLSTLTWLRVGGPADWLFMPADVEDLRTFLEALPLEVPIFPMGVGSNLIVRDGGIRGVVIRLGRAFGEISTENGEVRAGAAALDAQVAKRAADAGIDLTFLRTIPGSIGGAVRMNAGCYGSYVADHFVRGKVMDRSGNLIEMYPVDLGFGYRSTTLPPDYIVVDALFRSDRGEPEVLAAKMEDQLARRDASQPTKDLTAGSTFRNPAGFSSTGQANDTHELKAWKVIDDAGLRGATRGGAMMSKMHPNFLTNTGTATAADLEGLGEEVREKVAAHSGITLEWEIMRVGEPAPEAKER